MTDRRKNMSPGEAAVFDALMALPAPEWPGPLASYVRGTAVAQLPDVAAEFARSGVLEFTPAALAWTPGGPDYGGPGAGNRAGT